jgi:ribonuclease T1
VVSSRLPLPRQYWKRLALVITLTSSLWGAGQGVAKEAPLQAAAAEVSLVALPAEAQQVDRQIRSGGPFEYSKDGMVFGNRERRLPAKARGFYREYTVPTPGARDRGARRIVCGGALPASPESCYYTGDHYTSFSRIVQ